MRVALALACNFGSYKMVELDFREGGLKLIQGPTGSGKSTLCDIVPWGLFGRTSKNGNADEIISWNSTSGTYVRLQIDLNDTRIGITRTRGNSKNDLYYNIGDGDGIRGKDLNDTQKLINNLLGLTPELYLASAYFHEFSQTAQFFTTTAKNRRTICEQIVDLSLAKTLAEKLSVKTKETNILHEGAVLKTQQLEVELEVTDRYQKQETARQASWMIEQDKRREQLLNKYENFEAEKLEAISTYEKAEDAWRANLKDYDVCSECGTKLTKDHKHAPTSPFATKIQLVKARENKYLEQLAVLEAEVNPHIDAKNKFVKTRKNIMNSLVEANATIFALHCNCKDLELLQDCVSALRATTIANAISDIEHHTNQLLTDYFDGECQVSFTVEDADKLDVKITKDGNDCSYTQLSKGQRQMLKLSFAISVMRQASRHSGVDFSEIFLDEALDGLDENLKVKAFRLLESLALEYSSVFVVEHSQALKSMFTSGINVQLNNGHSEIYEN